MAVFQGTAGHDVFQGGVLTDVFYFRPVDLAATDVVAGGPGQDGLAFTAAGTVAASALARVTGIEEILLAVGGITLNLASAMVASAEQARVNVTGSSGKDVVLAGAVTAPGASVGFDGSDGGSDTVQGSAGADLFLFADGSLDAGDRVDGRDGTDRLVLVGGAALSTVALAGVRGIERIDLGDGRNTLVLADALVGSALGGSVTVAGGGQVDVIDGGAVTSPGNRLVILGGEGNDTLTGSSGRDTLVGGAGADRIAYKGTEAEIAGFAIGQAASPDLAADVLVVRANPLAAHFNLGLADQSVGDQTRVAGFSSVDGSALAGPLVVLGTSRGNALTGGGGGDTLNGGGGDDTLRGNGGADVLLGGAGADWIVGGSLDASIDGGGGHDTLVLEGSHDMRAVRMIGIEALEVDPGARVVLSGVQAQALETIRLSGAQSHAVFVMAGPATLDLEWLGILGGSSAVGFLSVVGSAGNDTILGSQTRDILRGGGGNDTILPIGPEPDTMLGEDGDDRIASVSPFAGGTMPRVIPTLDGGAGSDTLVHGGDVPVNLGAVDQTSRDWAVVRGFENVDAGGPAPLTALGSAGSNTLIGGDGADTLDGAGGADVIRAGGGNDRVVFDGGDVLIDGGLSPGGYPGDDVLVVRGTAVIDLSAPDQAPGSAVVVRGFEHVDASAAASVTLTGAMATSRP
ncbi:hypothetical protein [Zavarzinia sp. CC-PAN008]|uniref:hypothetical protein n=1 Tax=Zavarzinia sp. CC-PAN008 TaxID=3243332 RepID=UPI003F74A057